MNEPSKRIWISFEIPIPVEVILDEIAVLNKISLLALISDIIYKKTGIEINASDIRKKQNKHNRFLVYISLEIPKSKAIELTNKGLERKKSRQKLILEICEEFMNDNIQYVEEKVKERRNLGETP